MHPKRVALAIDVWRTAKKKHAKWHPKNSPAIKILFI
jgi:hypothetical protein